MSVDCLLSDAVHITILAALLFQLGISWKNNRKTTSDPVDEDFPPL